MNATPYNDGITHRATTKPTAVMMSREIMMKYCHVSSLPSKRKTQTPRNTKKRSPMASSIAPDRVIEPN